jgi:hypothetical protein
MIRWFALDPRPELGTLGCTGPAWDQPHLLAWGQTSFSQRMPTAVLKAAGPVQPLRQARRWRWRHCAPRSPAGSVHRCADLLDRRLFNDGLLVMHRGRVLHESYRNGLAPRICMLDLSKTLTTMMVGIAVGEGRLDPTAPIAHCVPALQALPAVVGRQAAARVGHGHRHRLRPELSRTRLDVLALRAGGRLRRRRRAGAGRSRSSPT